jgi:ornithine carbamoyltransferase
LPLYRFGALSHLKQSRSAALPSERARLSLEIAAYQVGGDAHYTQFDPVAFESAS